MSAPCPFPFQLDLVERTRAARARGNRIIVVQGATGSGKTTVMSYITRQAAVEKCKTALLLVHRRRLVDQISDRLKQFEVPHGVMMNGEHHERSHRVTVASRDTLMSRCVRNEWIGLPPADIVIVDEAHHAANPTSDYRRIIDAYPHSTVLLFSATPVSPDGAGLGPWAQAIECAAPTSELIRDGYLMPLKVYAPERKRKGNRYVRGLAGDMVESWKQYAEERPTVFFCGRVKHSLDAVEAFAAAGITAAHMDADTPDDERDRVFDEVVAGRIKVLCNVGIIGEGVDVPELGCCQLFCECGSRTGLLQKAGRVMRTAPGKRYGILIDHSGAVFRHGFPDEDTEWTLEGNVDDAFRNKHDSGETEKAYYCKRCELAYHGSPSCPQCGREPCKPPRSIFAPPPVDVRNEILTEADRADRTSTTHDEKVQHWFRCLAAAKKRNGTFTQASTIFKQKYGHYPDNDFPLMPAWEQRRHKIADVYPDFGKKKAQ